VSMGNDGVNKSDLRILHLSTHDVYGGAAIAAHRLHLGLSGQGADSTMRVMHRHGRGVGVVGPSGLAGIVKAGWRIGLHCLPSKLCRAKGLFTTAWLPGGLVSRVRRHGPDIVHLHWVANGMLRIEDLSRLGRPVVWTMHDAWPFTGGCHYPGDCTRFQRRCGLCPLLGAKREDDLSRWVWERKMRAWGDADVTFVAPSRWLADVARSSSLAAGRCIEVVPNGLDTTAFVPRPRAEVRRRMGLPAESAVVLFAAMQPAGNSRKGYGHLVRALSRLAEMLPGRAVHLAVLGADRLSRDALPLVPFTALGRLSEEENLARAYAAADVLAVPSLADNLPNTAMEAMACGTPVAAFAAGGLPEMVDHRVDGWLAETGDAEDLALGLAWLLEDPGRLRTLSEAARDKALRHYDAGIAAARYMEMYEKAAG